MIRKLILAVVITLFTPLCLFAGYDDLKRDFDDYVPPAFPHDEVAETQVSPVGEDRLSGEIEKLEKRAAAWEAILKAEQRGGEVLHLDPAAVDRTKPVAEDDAAVAKLLSVRFPVEVLEALTVERNPGIKAAEQRLSATIDAFGQVSNLEEILRRYSAFTEGVAPGVGPMLGKDTIAKKFPFPGLLSLKGEVAGKDAEIARQKLQIATRDAVATARKTWHSLAFLNKSIAITAETVALFRQLENVVSTRYEAGKTSFQDVIKVGIRLSTLEETLVTLKEKRRNAEVKILELLNLPAETPLGPPAGWVPEKRLPDLPGLHLLARKSRQELAIIRAKQGKVARMIEMAETMVIPPYTLNLSLYGDRAVVQVGSVAMKDTFPVKTAAYSGIGLPKNPWYGTSDPYLRQTRKNLLALGEELKRAEAQTATLVRSAWYGLDLALREERLFSQSIKDQSRAALDVSTSGYEAGKVSFADVISSYTGWLDASLGLEKRRSDIGIAGAEIFRVVGKSF